ncbi:MAG: hypothetical protein JWM05_1017 [Acidimicrobiales bacterium]|nr:hypothetical protein [Acidimicrobiales bacterium]
MPEPCHADHRRGPERPAATGRLGPITTARLGVAAYGARMGNVVSTASRSDDAEVPAPWVRLGAVALAVPQLAIGLWALVWSRSFFDRFPGSGPRLVAAEPPYNHHLVVDVGAAFFASAVVLIAAAIWNRRSGLAVALLGYLAFTAPHILYHATHPPPSLSTSAQALNAVLLSGGAALALVLVWGARRPAATPD